MLPSTCPAPSWEDGLPSATTACFSIAAFADPGVMPRVLELFAKRGLVPTAWHSRRHGTAQDELSIDIQVAELSPPEARHIAACLRQIAYVGSVLTSER